MLNTPRLLLLIAVVILFGIGLLMIFNTSSAEILDKSLNISTRSALVRQILYAIIGCFLGVGLTYVGYETFVRWSWPLLILFIVLLALVFVPGIGLTRNGAARWIGLGNFSFQPSEFLKLVLPAFVIRYVLSSPNQQVDFRRFLKLMAIVCLPLLLVFLEPNHSTTAILVTELIILLLITRIRFQYWMWPILVLTTIAVIVAVNIPYVEARLEVYRNPELDLKGKGHQPYQGKIAAGSGGLLGKGLGQSLQKLNYLPEAQNDYIAAIFGEEFGFIGILFLILLYMGIAYFGFRIASQARNKEGCYLATALTFILTFQAFINLGVVSGLLPSTGLNLPFFSQGGTSLIGNILSLALLLNIDYVSSKERRSQPAGQSP